MSLTTSERLQLALVQDHNGSFYPFDDYDLLNDAAEELDRLRAEVARLKAENEKLKTEFAALTTWHNALLKAYEDDSEEE